MDLAQSSQLLSHASDLVAHGCEHHFLGPIKARPPSPVRPAMAFKRGAAGRWRAPKKVRVSDAVRRYVSKRVANVGERKHIVASDSTTVSNTGGDWVLCGLDAGSNENQRIGERVKLQYLKFKAVMYAADTINRMRIIVYRKTHNQTTPTNTYLGYLDPNQYQVIYDEMFSLSTSLAPYNKELNFEMPISGIVQWNGTGQADTTGGQIWLRAVSDSSVVTHPGLDWCSIVTYRDT